MGVLIRNGKKRHAEVMVMGRQRQRWEWCLYKSKIPKIASNSQKPGERCGLDAPSEPPEGTHPADTSILDHWPLRQ